MAAKYSHLTRGTLATEFMLNELYCQILPTSDGSYSMCVGHSPSSTSEPMHSSKGAWSETLEIYAPALNVSLDGPKKHNSVWQVASIGLGLGYNEILTAGIALRETLLPELVSLSSFESQGELIRAFRDFFSPSTGASAVHPLAEVYDDICLRVSALCHLETQRLKEFVGTLISQGHCRFYGALTSQWLEDQQSSVPAHDCILFDAFSPASSPDLWNEALLQAMILRLAGQDCVLASYASRTLLKKVLKRANFTLEKRPGFAGKRESTFAVRKS